MWPDHSLKPKGRRTDTIGMFTELNARRNVVKSGGAHAPVGCEGLRDFVSPVLDAAFGRRTVPQVRRRVRSHQHESLVPNLDAILLRWDGELCRLWLGDRLLKWYRKPAPDQFTVLDAFQTAGWTVQRIDCPFPWSTHKERRAAHHRLRNSVRT